MKKAVEMFFGADGKVSAMRVSSLGIVFSVMGIFIAQNIVSMVHAGGFVTVSWEMISLVSAVLGVKAYQHKHENNGASEEEEETPEKPKEIPTNPTTNEIP